MEPPNFVPRVALRSPDAKPRTSTSRSLHCPTVTRLRASGGGVAVARARCCGGARRRTSRKGESGVAGGTGHALQWRRRRSLRPRGLVEEVSFCCGSRLLCAAVWKRLVSVEIRTKRHGKEAAVGRYGGDCLAEPTQRQVAFRAPPDIRVRVAELGGRPAGFEDVVAAR